MPDKFSRQSTIGSQKARENIYVVLILQGRRGLLLELQQAREGALFWELRSAMSLARLRVKRDRPNEIPVGDRRVVVPRDHVAGRQRVEPRPHVAALRDRLDVLDRIAWAGHRSLHRDARENIYVVLILQGRGLLLELQQARERAPRAAPGLRCGPGDVGSARHPDKQPIRP